jgi:hypothetical protein
MILYSVVDSHQTLEDFFLIILDNLLMMMCHIPLFWCVTFFIFLFF